VVATSESFLTNSQLEIRCINRLGLMKEEEKDAY